MKRCSKCGVVKGADDFYRQETGRDGLRSHCKACDCLYAAQYRERARGSGLVHRKIAPQKKREYRRRYNKKNPEAKRLSDRRYAEKHPGRQAAWRLANPEKAQIIDRRRCAKRRATSKGRINARMGTRIWECLQGGKRHKAWQALVGYTLHDLMRHLEKHFLVGMTWGNYGQWHIDHKIPLAAFNFEKPSDIDFRRAWALKNLQPMWAVDNIKKSARLEKPFQPSLAIAI